MRDEIEQALKGHRAEYIEIRWEESEGTRLQYRGRERESVGRSTARGGNVRALVKGGWGFVCFNEMKDLRGKVVEAVRQARLVGSEQSHFAPVPPIEDAVPPTINKDPIAVPLADKVRLLEEYNGIILGTPGVQSSLVTYGDGRRKVLFANSEGSFIEQGRADISLRVSATARKDGDVQQAGLSLGALGDFGAMEGLHEQVKSLAQTAADLLKAPRIPGGEYTVVLDPVLAGVFIHEAFGHLSEADHVYENERLKEIMVLGRRFGQRHFNVVDGAAVPGLRGSYKYDEEGTPATKTDLIREGVLVGRLHSRETAARMGETPTGNARALDWRFPPIVRMTNTYIEPGAATLDDLLEGIEDGVYVSNWYGGQTSMEMFTFASGESRRIRHGRIEELVRPVQLSGNLFTTLQNIDAIGNDLDMNQGGGCGKGMQVPLPVSNGSPHIRIRRCLVGGK
ncbi:MAG: TldD/PmbA family protein [Chloroflexi bacterium]|nr:TldD/PmbA family protein [Chloroflexota bacterium]